ncbi:MAG: succinate dehydrogenase cytochrome b subunit [Chlorobiaceae bacterium]|nr:succinate dehydrogenase cytochrome b subunit [Chlorobiaceae bacterium]
MDSSSRTRLSSITSKVIMALAGLFLVMFLLVHLGINLLLLANDGGQSFTAAAGFMATNQVIKIFEVVLFGGLLVHMFIGVAVSFRNRASRPVRYQHKSMSETSPLSRYMFHSGIIVFIFLVLHFIDFYFVKLGLVAPPAGVERHDFYRRSILLFSDKGYSAVYLVSFIFLGFHLNHAVQAAFQTIGMNHNKYIGTIKVASILYAIIVASGFMVIPFWFILFR